MKYNVHMVGVGGQGVLMAASIIGTAALHEGYEVAMSEVHGMAQRGGSVTSSVRIGDGVLSPLIPKGGSDLLLGFEPAETYRALPMANESTQIITNISPVYPLDVTCGKMEYPKIEEILVAIRKVNPHLTSIDASGLAMKAGKAIAANSVLVGAVSAVKGFPLSKERVLSALLEIIPRKHRELNQKAFDLGYQQVLRR